MVFFYPSVRLFIFTWRYIFSPHVSDSHLHGMLSTAASRYLGYILIGTAKMRPRNEFTPRQGRSEIAPKRQLICALRRRQMFDTVDVLILSGYHE